MPTVTLPAVRAVCAIVLFFAILFAAKTSFSDEKPLHLLELEQPSFAAPDFKLEGLDGNTHELSNYLGKPLVVNFWATWCPPCRAEIPSLNRAWQQLKDDGVKLIAISAGEDYDAVFAFTAEVEVDFPLLLDPNNTAFTDWPLRGLPTTYVLNSKGEVVYRAIGEREWDDGLIEKIKAVQ